MKIYKRVGSLILSLLLVFSLLNSTFAIQAYAATTPVLSVENKSVSAGEQFTVAVSLANATSVYGGNFTLQYDSNLLTADSFTFGSIVGGHTKNCNLDYQSAGNLIRFTFSGASALTSSGTLVTFTFTAKESASGSATLQFTAYKMYDENGSSITSTANESKVTISTKPVVSPSISITNKTVTVGETVSVPVMISNSSDVYGGNFTLQYDSSLLTATSYSFGSIVSGHTKNCNLDYQSAGNLIRVTFSGASAVSSDGTLVTFSFTAKAAGTVNLQFNAYKMYDENGSSIATTISNGKVTVGDNADTTKPTVSITSTNNVTESQTVTLEMSDNVGVVSYYWGTSSSPSSSSYTTITSTTSTTVTKTVLSAGTYYLIAKDVAGNATSTSVTFYKTTFDANGGSLSINYIITKSGNSVTVPAPTNSDSSMIFVGWGTSASATTGVKTFTVSSSKTYYALWVNSNIVSGQCGDDVYYELDINSGELIISGTGDMWDFTACDTPWYENYADIRSLEIQDSVTTIGTAAFSDCYYLTDVKFGSNIKLIGSCAFSHCSSLLSIVLPNGVEGIGDGAFKYCNDLSEIVLPDTIKSIGEDICGVTSFHSNDANWSGDVLYIGKHLVDTKFPYTGKCIIKDGTLTIADGVFHQSNLTSVVIPNSVANIGESAFSCTELTSVTIPSSVKEIKTDTFYHCLSLEKVTITYGTEIIGSEAFYYCPTLTTITIPRSVTYIGEAAFVLCDNLKTVIYNGSQYGSQEYWDLIEICDNNDELLKVKPQTVTKVIASIEVNNNPTKTTYYIGDALSTSGLKLLVTYSDGTTETVISGFTTSGFSSSSAGTKTITVTYGGKTTTFTVTVNTPFVSLSSTSKSMTAGDTATLTATTTPSGQTVTWTSSNTSVATVSGGTITAKAAGTATITAKFTYNGITYSKTCSVTVTSAPNPEPTLSSISIAAKPTKTTYEIGEALNTSGLTLKLTYSDGSTETVTSGFTTSGFDSATAGTKTVTVSYGGKTTSFVVNVEASPVNSPQYQMADVSGTAGSTVGVYVSIAQNPGIISLRNTISYDVSALELVKVEDCGLLAGYTTPSATISSPYTLRWADSLATENNTKNGQLVKLTFKIKDGTEEGEYNISVTPIEARNVDGTKVAFTGANATVNVIDYLLGDTDGDGEVTDWDAIVLNRYLAGWNVNIELAAADIDGDGEVSDWDAIVLERYLAGWNIELER